MFGSFALFAYSLSKNAEFFASVEVKNMLSLQL